MIHARSSTQVGLGNSANPSSLGATPKVPGTMSLSHSPAIPTPATARNHDAARYGAAAKAGATDRTSTRTNPSSMANPAIASTTTYTMNIGLNGAPIARCA